MAAALATFLVLVAKTSAAATAGTLLNRANSIISKNQNGYEVSKEEWESAEADLASCLSAEIKGHSNSVLASCYYSRGLVATLRQGGQASSVSLQAFSDAVRLNPKHSGALLQRAGQLLGLGRQEEGIQDMRRAVKLQPKQPAEILFHFALALPSGKERISLLRRVIKAEPNQAAATSLLITELQWHGQLTSASNLMQKAEAKGMFPSIWQRPPQFTPGLQAVEFWHASHNPMVASALQAAIRATPGLLKEYENFNRSSFYMHSLDSFHIEEHVGENMWQLISIYNGTQSLEACPRGLRKTCGFLQQISALGLYLIDSDFSVLEGGAHLRPHCGPHNKRLTFHVPLLVPTSTPSSIRVGAQHKTYEISEPFAFDDSFEHEVWNQSPDRRVILIFTVAHPDLAEQTLGSSLQDH